MAGSTTSRIKWDKTSVKSLPIHPRIISALRKGGLHYVSSVLEQSTSSLARRTGLDEAEVDSLVLAASRAVLASSPPCNALALYHAGLKQHNWGRLSVGCDLLDSRLRGGLLVPGLTEVAGVSGAGKTQLCLQLCLTAQLPREHGGLDAGAVYICTEDVFPTKRLQQLTDVFSQKHGLTAQCLSDNIFVEHVATISSLTAQLEYKLPSLLATGRVAVVVIDSIAALFRAEFAAEQAAQRALILQACGAQLQRLSRSYGVAVVCVNQVTAVVGGGRGGLTRQNTVRPALGLAWASLVGTRMMLSRDETLGTSGEDHCKAPVSVKRQLEVTFAPHLPLLAMNYYITGAGVHAREHSSDCCHQTPTNIVH